MNTSKNKKKMLTNGAKSIKLDHLLHWSECNLGKTIPLKRNINKNINSNMPIIEHSIDITPLPII